MYHNFRLLAGLVLYAVIASSWAAEQAVTRTITTDLGSNEPTMRCIQALVVRML